MKLDGALVTPLAQTDTEVRLQMPPHDNGYAIVAAVGAGGTAYGRYLYVPPRLDDLPPGYITTIAGVGAYNGQYGPAAAASLSGPSRTPRRRTRTPIGSATRARTPTAKHPIAAAPRDASYM